MPGRLRSRRAPVASALAWGLVTLFLPLACGCVTSPQVSRGSTAEGGGLGADAGATRPAPGFDAGTVLLADGSALHHDAGVRASASCDGGRLLCSGACVDTKTSLTNCGGCGLVCSGVACEEGQCEPAVPREAAASSDATPFAEASVDGAESPDVTTLDANSGDASGGGIDDCAHSPCAVGVALIDGCDDNGDETVRYVCEQVMASCCESGWTEACVDVALEGCGTGAADICIDPGC